MNKKRCIAIAVSLVVAMFGFAARRIYELREPTYEGHSLSYWTGAYDQDVDVKVKAAQKETTAIRQIGTNALPTVMIWLQKQDGSVTTQILNFLDRHPRIPIHLDRAAESHWKAYRVFFVLGPEAKPAVSDLIHFFKQPEQTNQITVSDALAAIGPAAKEAAPVLSNYLQSIGVSKTLPKTLEFRMIRKDLSIIDPAAAQKFKDW